MPQCQQLQTSILSLWIVKHQDKGQHPLQYNAVHKLKHEELKTFQQHVASYTSVWTILSEVNNHVTAFQLILRELQQADKTK